MSPKTSEPALYLSSSDVAMLARVSYRQLDHWTRAGWLEPHEPEPLGSGHPRVWSLPELAVAIRIGVLVKLGIKPRAAAHLAREGAWS